MIDKPLEPRAYHENQRERHGPLFLVAPVEGGTEILYGGALFMMIERDDRLPPGFTDRAIAHFMDLLTGRRTALWDEQAIFGAKPLDRRDIATRAAQAADQAAAEREAVPVPAAELDGLGLA